MHHNCNTRRESTQCKLPSRIIVFNWYGQSYGCVLKNHSSAEDEGQDAHLNYYDMVCMRQGHIYQRKTISFYVAFLFFHCLGLQNWQHMVLSNMLRASFGEYSI